MPIRFSPKRSVDSTKESSWKWSSDVTWPQRSLYRRPTQPRTSSATTSSALSSLFVIVLGDILTRRCASAGVTEGVDERVGDPTTSFAVEIVPPRQRRPLPPRSTSTAREVSFTRVWLPLTTTPDDVADDSMKRCGQPFGARMTSGCRSSFLRESVQR